MLSPGGLLVYSSCSKDIRQNEEAIIRLLNSQKAALLFPLPCRGLLYSSEGPNGCTANGTTNGMNGGAPHRQRKPTTRPDGGPSGDPLVLQASKRAALGGGPSWGSPHSVPFKSTTPETPSDIDGNRQGGRGPFCPVTGGPCRGYSDAYAFLESHAVWPAGPSGLEQQLHLPRHPSCWDASSSTSSSSSDGKPRPSSCQFLEEKGQTSGIFICCLTKAQRPPPIPNI